MSDLYRTSFKTTREGLDYDAYPMQLWRKAKKLGIWDPQGFDLSQDAEDWQGLDENEQLWLMRLTALFQAGEESVTYDILPLMMVIAEEQRIEEEMFLTSYLWEEAKHVEAFSRFFVEIAKTNEGLEDLFGEAYRQFFYAELPNALNRLRTDPSPVALAEASVTYQLITEGILAETGYYSYHAILNQHNIMPGMQQMLVKIQQDEARHLAYGVFLLSRLVAEHGDEVWNCIQQKMNTLLPQVIKLVDEGYEDFEVIPFGLNREDFTNFAMTQFQKRLGHIQRARGQTLQEIYYPKA